MTDSISNNIYDVIVVGSGAGGLTTATIAAQQGLSVLLVEKTACFGGTTAWSGGAPWIPCNSRMNEVDQTDSLEEAEQYLRSILGDHYDSERMSAYLQSGQEMVDYLEKNTHVKFYPIPFTDYYPSNPGAKLGRTLLTEEYDGRLLGDMVKKLRGPLPGLSAFGSMQSDPQYLPLFKKAFKTWEGFLFSSKRFIRFCFDLIRFGKGAHLANGNALAGRLLHSAMDAGVTLWNDSAVVELTKEGDRITGVEISKAGQKFSVKAHKAVVLATGGFGGNASLTKKWMPMPEKHISIYPEGNVGDGIRFGQNAGGVLADEPNSDNGVWVPVSVMRDNAGKIVAKYPHFGPDRAKPGSIIVNLEGQRFANEAAPYQIFVNEMHNQKIGDAWFIGDHNMLRNYGMGLSLPAPLPYKHFIKNGYLIQAASISELAKKLGIDASALESTVARFNENAVKNEDPDFARGSNIYDHSQGDWELSSPNLAPLIKAPFYAVKIHPGDVSSVYGLNTSKNAEVLNTEGNIIPGLYAVGLDQNTVMRGFYPGGGSGIGPAMTFGYRLVRHLVGNFV